MSNIVLFDASVHLGQFCTTSEPVRIGCKQSQKMLSLEGDNECIGLWTDNENGRVDNAIWSIDREAQDIFYPFMDRFYSVKNIKQIPLEKADTQKALILMEEVESLSFLSAYTCAVAIRLKVNEIHSLYTDLHSEKCAEYLRNHKVSVQKPYSEMEESFPEPELEQTYQDALTAFREQQVNILDVLDDSRVLSLHI